MRPTKADEKLFNPTWPFNNAIAAAVLPYDDDHSASGILHQAVQGLASQADPHLLVFPLYIVPFSQVETATRGRLAESDRKAKLGLCDLPRDEKGGIDVASLAAVKGMWLLLGDTAAGGEPTLSTEALNAAVRSAAAEQHAMIICIHVAVDDSAMKRSRVAIAEQVDAIAAALPRDFAGRLAIAIQPTRAGRVAHTTATRARKLHDEARSIVDERLAARSGDIRLLYAGGCDFRDAKRLCSHETIDGLLYPAGALGQWGNFSRLLRTLGSTPNPNIYLPAYSRENFAQAAKLVRDHLAKQCRALFGRR